MNARNADYLDQTTFAQLMKPWIHNSERLFERNLFLNDCLKCIRY